MQDYPELNDDGMSQVHHGEKMLLDTPASIATPAVRVDGKIYFVDELLQCSTGLYFIPERFFYRVSTPPEAADGSDLPPAQKELHALGFDVTRSAVSSFGLHAVRGVDRFLILVRFRCESRTCHCAYIFLSPEFRGHS
jgi:hypothetical protein